MSYIENNLISDETVIYKAKIHWFIYLPSITLFVYGLVRVIAFGFYNSFLGACLMFVGFVMFISATIKKKTTELAVTSKQVIAKFGLIKRTTVELNLSKVESYNVDQSIAGRLLGFGTITIIGTGGGKTPISSIDEPLEFRKFAMETMDNI